MLALDIGQHKGAGKPVEHVRRRRAAAPLLKARVPSQADVGALRHFIAAQAERAAAFHWKAKSRRIELAATVSQVDPERILDRRTLGYRVSHLTTIISRLY
ncbi:hypothetical protein GCM10011611_17040 [Aliidongia dinghuensis]|uniref:Uncharacterized protein n=1 Tax=Aliidongia dinghuensis TaxID=1867774 RepID=A0A8J2YS16_9PROT|nr:hypothetical protein GCM10011611_17040 [Aliidongia dinghuensis]